MMVFFTLCHSSFSSIVFDPGLVDSPPISIIVAPLLIINLAWLYAFVSSKNNPPSEKLSGVILSAPIIRGVSNFNPKILSSLEVIFFRSFSIVCNISLSSFLISLIE